MLIAQGRSVDELQKFLSVNSSEALPQPVAQFLADLKTRTTSLQDLGSARLIRCTDTALATLIANDSRTKAYCFLADQPKTIAVGQACYLVVPAETETKFRNALKKLGLQPSCLRRAIMSYVPENALIIQSDRSVLLEVHSPRADAARDAVAPFAELIKSPEHIHTYQISPLSIWNARAAGMPVSEMIAALREHAKYQMPEAVAQEIESLGSRYGLTVIERGDGHLLLKMADLPLAELLSRNQAVSKFLGARPQI
jgi:DNA-directed RNA polymerase subunit N (RpoN/RPB10)